LQCGPLYLTGRLFALRQRGKRALEEQRLERQSYGYGAAPMARVMFAAAVMRGDTVKNDIGIDLAGLPADDCAVCFHGLHLQTFAATTWCCRWTLFRADDFFSPVHDC